MADTPKLILIDGSSFLYRAYYAAKGGFSTRAGIPTGAVLILTRMLKGLIKDYPGHKMLVTFDAGGKTFRSELYPDYKANRPPMPDDLRAQLEYVHKIAGALGLPVIQERGVEADDVLGSYALTGLSSGFEVVICTGDKDLCQLVRPGITIRDTLKNAVYDEQGVKEKYGVEPCHIVDYLALKGDAADNIPGLPGVGDVTALAVINSLGGIEEIKESIDKVKDLNFRGARTFADKFLKNYELVKLSYDLASIKTDLPLPLSLEDIKPPKKDLEALLEVYQTLEFHRFYEEEITEAKGGKAEDLDRGRPGYMKGTALFGHAKPKEDEGAGGRQELPLYEQTSCSLILNKEELDAFVAKIKEEGKFSLFIIPDGEDFHRGKAAGAALAVKDQAVYIPLRHSYLGMPALLPKEDFARALNEVLSDPKIKKYGYDVKTQLLGAQSLGLEISSFDADAMLMAHLIDSAQNFELGALCSRYLGISLPDLKNLVGTGIKNRINAGSTDVHQALPYMAQRARCAYLLCEDLKIALDEVKNGASLLTKLEIPCAGALYRMEQRGAYVNSAELHKQNDNLTVQLKDIEKQIYTSAGRKFNIASPKQLGTVLFDYLHIPYPKKAKLNADGSYSYSTAEEILTQVGERYDIANLVLRYRALSKLISTYTEKLPSLIDSQSRIYTSFNLAGTVTGRLSSANPNLQNIPARTPEGKNIRKAFCAPCGYKILSADYSQIELRLIAHFSGDPNLTAAFVRGEDIHKATASQVLGIPLDEVTARQRSSAKATNFGLMYGMSAHGLSVQTGMSYKEAQTYMDNYFARYPLIKEYLEQVKAEAAEKGYIETLFGRRVTIPGIKSSSGQAVRGAQRAAINAPMQGSAADIIKQAMVRLDEYIRSLGDDRLFMTLQVHDELVFEVKEDFAREAAEKIVEIMQGAARLNVPLVVEAGIADNWAAAH